MRISDWSSDVCSSDLDSSMARAEMEIIEIGAVMVERATLRALDEFQAFVRPVRHPHLTAFCTRLTSIQQADVDAAEGFPAVLAAFRAWIYRHHVVGWGPWGRYDLRQFEFDCGFPQLPLPFGFEHTKLGRMSFREKVCVL